MSHAFYPFVDNDGLEDRSSSPAAPGQEPPELGEPQFAARIAVYDDAAVAPRVVIVDPKDVRSYLEEITQEVTKLSHEHGGQIPFTVIREIVENFVHAYFIEPAISILPGGNTIRFSDQGPGIKEKDRALEFGTTSATMEMKRYIRGTGSGLPLAQQYLIDKGGSLLIEDNMSRGPVVTISLGEGRVSPAPSAAMPTPTTPDVAPTVRLDDRGQKVVAYLGSHESVGPKELVSAYGESNSTWSRALKKLTEAGLIYKDGQKYYLTAAAKALV